MKLRKVVPKIRQSRAPPPKAPSPPLDLLGITSSNQQ